MSQTILFQRDLVNINCHRKWKRNCSKRKVCYNKGIVTHGPCLQVPGRNAQRASRLPHKNHVFLEQDCFSSALCPVCPSNAQARDRM